MKVKLKNRNEETLADFVAYCQAHPEFRFWQALRNWSVEGVNFVYVSKDPLWQERVPGLIDTFYWEGKGPNANLSDNNQIR